MCHHWKILPLWAAEACRRNNRVSFHGASNDGDYTLGHYSDIDDIIHDGANHDSLNAMPQRIA